MLPERMLKVNVIILKSKVDKVVKSLQEAGLVHLEIEKGEDEWMKRASPLKSMDAVAREVSLIREVKTIGKMIGVETGGNKRYTKADLEQIVGLQGEMNDVSRIIEGTKDRLELLTILRRLRLNSLPVSQRISYEVFECTPKKIEKVIMACEGKNLDFEYSKGATEAYIIIAGSAADREAIREIAKEHGLLPVKIGEEIKNVDKEIKRIENEKKSAEKKASQLRGKIRERLMPIMGSINSEYIRLQNEVDRAEAVLKFGESERLYFVNGWVRERDRAALEKAMEPHKEYAALTFEKPHHGELPPTALKTSNALKPFESLLTFISTPRSDEIDPTNLIALTLPIMFGIIVGDVGYALVLALISAFYMNKMKGILGDIMKITFISSFWGILWGLIFGEFFGFEFELELLGIQFPLISRLHGVISLLLLTIGIGALHIMLGNLLGAIEGVMHREWKHAIAKSCWVLIEIGLIGLIVNPEIGGALALIALIGIIATEGGVGLIEVPGLLANIMSYARLAAVGLSGVILAMLINMMRPDPSQGIFIIVMFIAFAMAHFVAIVLAAFESLIQGGRLHAVEFFSKFFRGGGIPFNPFKMKEVEKR